MNMPGVPQFPGLADVLASGALARLVLFFLLFPEERPGLRDLERRTGLGSRTLQHELARMQALGWIVMDGGGGRARVQRRDPVDVWDHLRGLARRVAHPEEVLRIALAELDGIEAAFIYGSVARGQERPESDVDVLLVGRAGDRAAFGRRSLEASALLGREVNATVYSRATLRERGTRGFLKRVLEAPRIWIVGDASRLLNDAA